MLTKQQELYIASRGDHIEELIAEADPVLADEIHYNPNPTAKELKHLLDIDPRTKAIPAYKKAIELKLQSLTQEPTAIEKTMTPEQLYNANSPFWVNEYNINDLEKYFSIDERPSYNETITFINAFRH